MLHRGLFICLGLIYSVGFPTTVCAHENKDPRYIIDQKNRALIFRRNVDLRDTIVPLASIPFGFFCLFLANGPGCQTPGVERAMGIILISIGVGAIYLSIERHFRKRKPLIILDEKSLWYENWNTPLLWKDITEINFIRVDQYEHHRYGGASYDGFFWKIEIRTTQQDTWVIDERGTALGESNRRSLYPTDLTDGGPLGTLIYRYFSKYKSEEQS